MREIAWWLGTRGVLAAAAVPLAYGLGTAGVARAPAFALVGLAAVAFAVAARSSRTLLWGGADPELVGGRVGLASDGVDHAVLLMLAWFVPIHGLPGLGPASGLSPGPVVVKVVVLLSVAHLWLRVMHSPHPARAVEVLHPAMVIAAGLASWFVVDRHLPLGAGQDQAASSVLVAGVAVAWVLAVQRLLVLLEGDHARAGRPRTT